MINEGSSLDLTCSGNGSQPVMYKWTMNGQTVVSSDGQLSIKNVSRSDAGSYVCTATNNYGSMESSPRKVIVRCEYFRQTFKLCKHKFSHVAET